MARSRPVLAAGRSAPSRYRSAGATSSGRPPRRSRRRPAGVWPAPASRPGTARSVRRTPTGCSSPPATGPGSWPARASVSGPRSTSGTRHRTVVTASPVPGGLGLRLQQRGGPRRRRRHGPVRQPWRDRRRPPPARRHEPQLRRRPHAMGNLAVVRGGGERAACSRSIRSAVRPPVAHVGMGRFLHEGAAVDGLDGPSTCPRTPSTASSTATATPSPATCPRVCWKQRGSTAAWCRGCRCPTRRRRRRRRGHQVPGATPFRGRRHLVRERRRQPGHQVRRPDLGLRRRRAGACRSSTTGRRTLSPSCGESTTCAAAAVTCSSARTCRHCGYPADPEVCVVEADGLTSVFLRACRSPARAS